MKPAGWPLHLTLKVGGVGSAVVHVVDVGGEGEDWAVEHEGVLVLLRFIETWLNHLPFLLLWVVVLGLFVLRRDRGAAY